MRLLLLLPVLVSGILAAPAFAEPPASPPSPARQDAAVPAGEEEEAAVRKIVEGFFARLNAKEVEQAYDQLLKGTRIAESAADVSMLKTKTREALEIGGAIRGVDLTERRRAGNHVMSLTYISLGETYPLRWRFYFYKTRQQWKLIDIRISDRLVEMLGEANPPAGESAP